MQAVAIPQWRPAGDCGSAIEEVEEVRMERSRQEGHSDELSGRHGQTIHCDHELEPVPLAGLLAEANLQLAPTERLSRLLSTLESNIIPRLARAHRAPPALVSPEVARALVTDDRLELFTRHLVERDDGQVRGTIDTLLSEGVPREQIYLGLLAPAGRRLGEMWEQDECTFGDVTVGMGRLQRLLREMIAAADPAAEQPLEGQRVLLLASPGEQHTFGLSIVSEFFRSARWDVTCSTDTHSPDPVSTVRAEWFDTIGFSVGTHTRLDWLAIAIADVRRASRNSEIVVLVGGPVISIHPEYVATVGADASASDGRQAPVVAADLLRRRGSPV